MIDSEQYWTCKDRFEWKNIQTWLDQPKDLWGLQESSCFGLNDRVITGQKDGSSLYLIQPDHLSLLVGLKAPGFDDKKRVVRGEFTYQDEKYRMIVTDPVIERQYLNKEDGDYDIDQPVLCVSLGDEYKGYYYKLITAVLYPERFK